MTGEQLFYAVQQWCAAHPTACVIIAVGVVAFVIGAVLF